MWSKHNGITGEGEVMNNGGKWVHDLSYGLSGIDFRCDFGCHGVDGGFHDWQYTALNEWSNMLRILRVIHENNSDLKHDVVVLRKRRSEGSEASKQLLATNVLAHSG